MALQHSDRGMGIPKLLPSFHMQPHPPPSATSTNPSTYQSQLASCCSAFCQPQFPFYKLNHKLSIFGVLTQVSLIEGQHLSVTNVQIVAKRHEAEQQRWREPARDGRVTLAGSSQYQPEVMNLWLGLGRDAGQS